MDYFDAILNKDNNAEEYAQECEKGNYGYKNEDGFKNKEHSKKSAVSKVSEVKEKQPRKNSGMPEAIKLEKVKYFLLFLIF